MDITAVEDVVLRLAASTYLGCAGLGNPDRGVLIIDARTGSLHESAHTRWLGSPKTASSARKITLPPFLITMLSKHLERHDNEFMFTAEG